MLTDFPIILTQTVSIPIPHSSTFRTKTCVCIGLAHHYPLLDYGPRRRGLQIFHLCTLRLCYHLNLYGPLSDVRRAVALHQRCRAVRRSFPQSSRRIYRLCHPSQASNQQIYLVWMALLGIYALTYTPILSELTLLGQSILVHL